MKAEMIVAKIEEYINSLSREDREAYDGVMAIKAKHPQESVSTFANALGSPILNLAVIVDELRQEIKEAAIKQTKGNSTLQRIKKINKYLSKNDDSRPQIKKAWIENEKMCITNGFTGFMFNEALDGVVVGDQTDFNLSKCFPDESTYKEITLDIADVKSKIKLHKAKEAGKKAKDKTAYQYIIDGHYYNAEYLVDAYEILGGDIVFKQNDNVFHPAIMENENGKAVVLPIRPPKENIK